MPILLDAQVVKTETALRLIMLFVYTQPLPRNPFSKTTQFQRRFILHSGGETDGSDIL